MIKAFMTTFCAIAAIMAAAAREPVVVNTELDSAVVVMGSQLKMTLTLTAPESSADSVRLVNAPEITDNEVGMGVYWGTFVVGIESDTVTTDGKRTLTNTYTLQAFDPGLLAIPPVGAVAGSSTDTTWAERLTLKVLPMEVDTVAMTPMPAAGIVSAHNRWYDYIPLWTLVLLIAIIVIVSTIFIIMATRKHKETIAIQAQKPLPPYELAMVRLEELRRSGKAIPGQEKAFYTELTEILRQYLRGRFGINAMEMTSGQIVRALRSNPETRIPSEQVNAVLQVADFVKFAKEKPLADDNQRALQRATEFVETTKPLPEPPSTSDTVGMQPGTAAKPGNGADK